MRWVVVWRWKCRYSSRLMADDFIHVEGARTHNLKNISVQIPHRRITVITGPSGSGKSSLAFHTLYAEGQRRYVETFSPYTRQFLDRMAKPDVDKISGIPPAIAIEQANAIKTSRSTVGTMTEIADYLKLLFPRMAELRAENGRVIRPYTAREAWEAVLAEWAGAEVLVVFEISLPEETRLDEAFKFIQAQGFTRIFHEGAVIRSDDTRMEVIGETRVNRLRVIQDRVRLESESTARGVEAVESAYHYGDGVVIFMIRKEDDGWEEERYAFDWRDPNSGKSFRAPFPALFTFNHPVGACPRCRGFGRVIEIDYDLALPDRSLSIKQGVVKPFRGEQGADWQRELLRACAAKKISVDKAFCKLGEEEQRFVIFGNEKDHIKKGKAKDVLWPGVAGYFRWLETKAYKMHVRVLLSRYRTYRVCPDCGGSRFAPESLQYRLRHPDRALTIAEVNNLPITEAVRYFESLPVSDGDEPSRKLVEEILTRLRYLDRIGLGYLNLNRASRTLSGGEIQRVNLTACLGNSLVNTLFVLDEPTIGLHPHDNARLIDAMRLLRDRGNTLIVVEHDEAVIREADYVLDLGPGRGETGGKIVAEGTPSELIRCKDSLTASYLRGEKKVCVKPYEQSSEKCNEEHGSIRVYGATANNLKGIDVTFPLGKLVVITGVSGSGKSTLVHEVLTMNLKRYLSGILEPPHGCERIEGHEQIGEVVVVDQSPLTKTPRSNPVLYTGAFDAIRELFALTDEASQRGLSASAFSFNSDLGRCPHCQGTGYERVTMQFLADVWVECPVCHGRRFQNHILEVRYRGKSIHEVLELTVEEAMDFFSRKTKGAKDREKGLCLKVTQALKGLMDVGLNYLKLGQPLNQLSGGEAQRLKLMSYLIGISAPLIDDDREPEENTIEAEIEHKNSIAIESKPNKKRVLILDEPTTGLHFDDVRILISVLHNLVKRGESLFIIEHHTELIRSADWIIDLGPGAGDQGGAIVATGTVEDLIKHPTSLTSKYLGDSTSLNQSNQQNSSAKNELPPLSSMKIVVTGAREHNLKNISTDFTLGKMHVITGLSGSGKSTLAFDILFAEGQRRYLDSLNAYARQFVEQLSKPDVDSVTGLPPAVAIEQRLSRGGAKSTVATVTETYHFLRLLFAKLGVPHDPDSGEPAQRQSPDALVSEVLDSLKKKRELTILAPIIKSRKGYHTDIAQWAQRRGYPYLRVDGKWIAPNEFSKLDRYTEHTIDIVLGNIAKKNDPRANEKILREALSIGHGVFYTLDNASHETVHSRHWHCLKSGLSFDEPDPRWFSFNSPHGWCPRCEGHGVIYETLHDNETDDEMETDDGQGVICPDCMGERLNPIARAVRLPLGQWDEISKLIKRTKGKSAENVIGPRLPELLALPLPLFEKYLKSIKLKGREAKIAIDILKEILQRIAFLRAVGLDYLTLDRPVRALSGGEAQRITLAAQLGSNLQGVLYVLDEPTIGLHARDNEQLIRTLHKLRDAGNTLVIVEHDEEVMKAADRILDLGPGAGKEGGEIIADGDWKSIAKSESSVTGKHLQRPLSHPIRGSRRKVSPNDPRLYLEQVNKHNLRDLSLSIPAGRLVVLCGVSGAGKSTLLLDVMKPLLASLVDKKQSSHSLPGKIRSDLPISRVVEVDQSPLGRTSRSTPATYLGLLDTIRDLFASTPLAKQRGYASSRFSYNSKGGRCEHCLGQGQVKVEMQFLPVFYMPCEACGGSRYNAETLEILFKDRSIADVLAMSAKEAALFFKSLPELHLTLSLMVEVGLGYVALGQPSNTLSGGEAQRLRLVAELAQSLLIAQRLALRKIAREKPHYVYLLEEPTIGLHGEDVKRLLELLHRLVDEGHSVIVVEHHLDLVAEADWLIELGPEAGEKGGKIVFEGLPEDLAKKHPATATAPYLRELLK